KSGLALDVEMSQTLAPVIGAVIVRVKHLFDLGAVPDAVSALLSQDPLLAGAVPLPDRRGARSPRAPRGSDLRRECRAADRGARAAAGGRPLDSAVHRHARAALAGRLSRQRSDAGA